MLQARATKSRGYRTGTTAESKGAELANNVAEQIEAFGPDDGHRDELQHDVFGEHVTVAEAKKCEHLSLLLIRFIPLAAYPT